MRTLFDLKGVRDIDCAFKIVRRDVFKAFQLETTGAMISTELLVKSSKNGLRIMELGVKHYPRRAGVQTGAKISVIIRAFKELFSYFIQWQRQGLPLSGLAPSQQGMTMRRGLGLSLLSLLGTPPCVRPASPAPTS